MSKHKVIGLLDKSGKPKRAKVIDLGTNVIWKPQNDHIIFDYKDLLEETKDPDSATQKDQK